LKKDSGMNIFCAGNLHKDGIENKIIKANPEQVSD